MKTLPARATALALLLVAGVSWAGEQRYEPLGAAVRAQMQRSVADRGPQRLAFQDAAAAEQWLRAMSTRLVRDIPDASARREFLSAVHYEATRAGLDPQLVLGLIQVESAFRKYAVSPAGARGYMQVMPFWTDTIGSADHNLFHLRTNLRYGCTILRHYLDLEAGDLYRALGRYNGSLGRPGYPERVHRAWRERWQAAPPGPMIQTRQGGSPRPMARD
jgi:soluble lytic murein transglycosylase-like protein